MFQRIAQTQIPSNSKIFNQYLKDSNWRKEYFGFSFLNLEGDFLQRCKHLASQSFDRSGLSSEIKSYMMPLGISEKVNLNLEKLKNPDCVCIVAGQQPSLFGGPLYNHYKAITAIKIAEQMEAKIGKPFVPVFWNASNDHDIDEANRFYYLDKNRRLVKNSISSLNADPLDRVYIAKEILSLKNNLEGELSRVDFLDVVWQKLLPHPHDTIGTWQTRILNQLYSEKGLLILEPRILKNLSQNPFEKFLQKEDQFIHQIKENSEKLKNNNYEVQVDTHASSRMMLYQKQKGRARLTKQKDQWSLGKQNWTLSAMLANIKSPDLDLTPDALGRPIWQDMIIPVAAYIAGPGEIAYYHQLKDCYEIFGMKMPLILPRESGTIFEKNHLKFMNHYQVPLENFFEIKQWTKVLSSHAASNKELPLNIIKKWQESATNPEEAQIFERFKVKLEKLNRKYYERVTANRKNREEIGNKQLQEWKDFIFPMNLSQERVYGVLPLMARHGPSIFKDLEEKPYQWGQHFLLTMNDG